MFLVGLVSAYWVPQIAAVVGSEKMSLEVLWYIRICGRVLLA